MAPEKLYQHLRFYFITDDKAAMPVLQQVEVALQGGATMVQYRNKAFSIRDFDEVKQIQTLCRANEAPLIINDNILLAKAVGADGVHLGQDDEDAALARQVLGARALVGVSVSTPEELLNTDLASCDYIGTGPVFGTATKADAKPTIGMEGLTAVVKQTNLPVVAIGGVDPLKVHACLAAGARGVAVISAVTRADRPLDRSREMARACGITEFPENLRRPWNDEFALIRQCLEYAPPDTGKPLTFSVPPGDDAAVLRDIKCPVITTDAHVEGVHFRFDWQTGREVGRKAAVAALSDLAASYAAPVTMFVNLSLPANVPADLVGDIYAGLKDALEMYGCLLGGGNVSTGESVALNLFVLGECRGGVYPLRSGAIPGDWLCCTGHLGLARAGLTALYKKLDDYPNLVDRFKSPQARFDAANILASCGVKCVIDVSDGLAGDAGHIAAASMVTITFDWDKAFVSPKLEQFCEQQKIAVEEMILKGGEDYELLFACTPEQFADICHRLDGVYRIGRCLAYDGTYLKNMPAGIMSFQHGHSD